MPHAYEANNQIRLHPPVKFFLFKIITYPGNDSQQAVAPEYTVVLEFLPIRNSMFAAITQKKRINQRRTAYTSQFIKVYCVATNQSIPNLSPEFQILIDRLLFRMSVSRRKKNPDTMFPRAGSTEWDVKF